MNIIVCIKQVPETTDVRINPETNTLIREGVKSIINPFDMYAIEEGIRLKERFGGKVTVVTMGPPQADAALREAIALGVDEGVLVCDRAFAGSDTWATSYTLAGAIKKIGNFDLIICGKQASDGDTAQVGPGIATHLDIPQVTYVKKVEDAKEKLLKLERMLEEGYEVIELPLPGLITVVKEINEPRLPSLKGMMRSKQAVIAQWGQKDLNLDPQQIGLCGSPTQVVKIFTPPQRTGGQMLAGEIPEVVNKLAELLRSEL
ncbi:MAG: electron transfer flavoprotein subunit beta/FixA family protein [Candidatus Omnitrophica bacterium]|jgi:electron transfer flavoprotein beta subunit|nr:electron transfer flavoprotein subunit beta/FixA family protein [Candidatus Omnitrophota bacterium]